jgi:hypothetical protein
MLTFEVDIILTHKVTAIQRVSRLTNHEQTDKYLSCEQNLLHKTQRASKTGLNSAYRDVVHNLKTKRPK